MQGLQNIYYSDQPNRRDGYVQEAARRHLEIERSRWFDGTRAILDIVLARVNREYGRRILARSRRGRAAAARVRRAVGHNIKMLERLEHDFNIYGRTVWDGWLSAATPEYNERPGIAVVGNVQLVTRELAGRVGVWLETVPELTTCTFDGGEPFEMMHSRVTVHLVDGDSSRGRWALNSLVGYEHELREITRFAVVHSEHFRAALKQRE